MKLAIIEGGIVTNTVNVPDDWTDGGAGWQKPSGTTAVDVTGTPCGKGWAYEGGEFLPPAGPEPTLEEAEADALLSIDRAASFVRERFITRGTGQSAVYLSKYEEARAYKSASSPTDADYPYLNKEAARRGMTMNALADEVIATRNAWADPAGATIEAERVGGKADVRGASTVADKQAARDSAIATLDGITP